MTISILADGEEILEKHIRFSDGGSNIKLKESCIGKYYKGIFVTIENEPVDSYMYLVHLASKTLDDNVGCWWRGLVLPYFPHARADRKFEEGMSNDPPAAFLTQFFIEHQKFDEVITWDIHSNVPQQTVSENRLTELRQLDCFLQSDTFPGRMNCDVLVSPDKGAKSKTEILSNYLKKPQVTCDKVRDPKTGFISDITVNDPSTVKGKKCLIVDDICDGGMTFILTANKLREFGAKSVDLYVTHGIFSKGLDCFKGLINNIYCYHTVNSYVTITEIKNFNDEKWEIN